MAEYIEKQAVLDEIDEEIQEFPECEYALSFSKRWIKKLPPADVRPVVRGEWKHLGGDEWCCDQCGHVISTEGSWEHPLRDRNVFFCELCGADMRGGEQS